MAAAGKKSKKPSDANSKPPEPLVVFRDRALGNKLAAQALREAGVEVHLHGEHFPQDAKDHEWLPEVGKRGWVLLTKDSKIRYHRLDNALTRRNHMLLASLAPRRGEGMGEWCGSQSARGKK